VRMAKWSFLRWNQNVCEAIEKRLPKGFTQHLHTTYKFAVSGIMNERRGQTVLDVGGGKECPFLPFLKEAESCRIVAFDISEPELRLNADVKRKVVGDATTLALPFADETFDLVVSRSVVEHLQDVEHFFREGRRILKPGGYAVHTFPCKHTPFAMINRILPNWLARRILFSFFPEWTETCGFRAYYDGCTYKTITQRLARCGYSVVRVDIRYYQAIYYTFFVPLYGLMVLYDLAVYALGVRSLACQLLIIARREPGTAGAETAQEDRREAAVG